MRFIICFQIALVKKKKKTYTRILLIYIHMHTHTYVFAYLYTYMQMQNEQKNSQIMWVYGFIVPFSAHVKIVISCKTERSK